MIFIHQRYDLILEFHSIVFVVKKNALINARFSELFEEWVIEKIFV